MVPEDRKEQGLNLGRTSAEIIAFPWGAQLGRTGLITRRRIAALAGKSKHNFDIRGQLNHPVVGLSGGR